MNDPFQIMIWAQMFFDDGSVSQGFRVPEVTYDDDRLIEDTAQKILLSLNRDEGFLLLWGAGRLLKYDVISDERAEVSDSLDA